MKRRVIIATSYLSDILLSIYNHRDITVVGILSCNACHIHDDLYSFSVNNNIPYLMLNLQDENEAEWIKNKQADIMAVFFYPHLLRKLIYSTPQYGAINMHPSLLPKYRGINPWFWVYYNQEKETGVTIHFLDTGSDTGDIISSVRITIECGEMLHNLRNKAIAKGTELLVDALLKIDTVKGAKQKENSPTAYAKLVNEPWNMIDWDHWTTKRVWHLLRGFPDIIPLPQDVFQRVGEYQYTNTYYCDKGSIYQDDTKYIIQCKDGIINLTL